jgi:putative transposase
MGRRPRLDIASLPQHVVQRGNNRQRCFFESVDRTRYLHDLRSLARHHQCLVHAYVLMGNHVHLLLTPTATGQLSALMHALAKGYARTCNRLYGRTGSLWEGRYRSCLVDSSAYLLRCYRYIELNPVRAGMVTRAEDHRWSSYHANALGEDDPLVTPHPEYLALGPDDSSRRCAYRALVAEGVTSSEADLIRQRLRAQHALGGQAFREMVERIARSPAGPLPVGRPLSGRTRPGADPGRE